MKPRMFKLGGAWVWICEHPAGAEVGDVFLVDSWNSAWDACLGSVIKHAMFYHVAAVEVTDLDNEP